MKKFFLHSIFDMMTIISIVFFSCRPMQNNDDTKTYSPLSYVNHFLNDASCKNTASGPLLFLPHAMMRIAPCKREQNAPYIYALPLVNADTTATPSISFIPIKKDMINRPCPRLYFKGETYTPYSYHTFLTDLQLNVDFALSEHAAIYRFNYKNNAENEHYFRIAPCNRACRISINKNGDMEIVYPLLGTGKANLYVYLKCNKALVRYRGSSTSSYYTVKVKSKTGSLSIKYGISLISIKQAEQNLHREIPDFEYNIVAKRAKNIWQNSLKRIRTEGGNSLQKKTLYAALYRSLALPISISEDGRHYSADLDSVLTNDDRDFYTMDLLSETHLSLHPLMALVFPEVERNAIKSLIKMSKTSPSGTFPTYPTYGGNLVGIKQENRSLVSIVSSYNRGFTDIDLQAVFRAALNAVSWYHPDEYDIILFNDLAKKCGHSNAEIHYDSSKYADINSLTPDSISKIIKPYNIEELVERVDHDKLSKAIAIVTRNLEKEDPTINDLFLYYLPIYMGNSEKSTALLSMIQKQCCRNSADIRSASIGAAAKSAAIVFSMIGIYPVSPRKGTYTVGAPCFDAVRIDNGTGSIIKIDAPYRSKRNTAIEDVAIDGGIIKPYQIPHNKLIQGHRLVIKSKK